MSAKFLLALVCKADKNSTEIWPTYPGNGVSCHCDSSGALSRLEEANGGHGTWLEAQSAKFGRKNDTNLPQTRLSGHIE
jgi:hypothetical protein